MSLIAAGLGLVTSVVTGWFEGSKQEREIKAAVAENKVRLARETSEHNHEWEMANLTDKDKWLRRISFAMFTWPFIWIAIDAQAATLYFDILDKSMPSWYKETYMAITGGIWGISALKNAVPSVVGQVMSAVRK